jgi:hypothetical protein
VALPVRSTSQPLLPSPSQLPRPVMQAVTVQRPIAQAAVPVVDAQRLPHAPQ